MLCALSQVTENSKKSFGENVYGQIFVKGSSKGTVFIRFEKSQV